MLEPGTGSTELVRPSKVGRLNVGLYPWLTERWILPAFDIATGGRIVAFAERKKREQWLGEEQLAEIQQRRIADTLTHCWDHVPFYRSRFEALGLQRAQLECGDVLPQLPVLTKQEVIRHHQELTDRSSPRRFYWTTTGGSTGETVRLCVDRMANSSRKAREVLFHSWMGIREGERVGRLWGSPIDLRGANSWKRRLERRIKNVLFLDGYNMSPEAMERYAIELRRFRPALLLGFTSCLNLFAQYLEQRGIDDLRPRAVATTASPLYPKFRRLFEQLFRAPVYDNYGSREFGGMAYECPAHSGLHVAMDDVHISVGDAGGAKAENGSGELIVTGLANRAFPLVRYAIKDLGRLVPGRCDCGRGLTRIQVLRGRSSEVLRGPRGVPVLGEYFIDLFDALPGEILRFRIYQESPTRLALHLVAPGELREESRRYILRSIAEKFGEQMEVEFIYLDRLDPLPSGKELLTINRSGSV